jgi:hypothetical protein
MNKYELRLFIFWHASGWLKWEYKQKIIYQCSILLWRRLFEIAVSFYFVLLLLVTVINILLRTITFLVFMRYIRCWEVYEMSYVYVSWVECRATQEYEGSCQVLLNCWNSYIQERHEQIKTAHFKKFRAYYIRGMSAAIRPTVLRLLFCTLKKQQLQGTEL